MDAFKLGETHSLLRNFPKQKLKKKITLEIREKKKIREKIV